jgi:pimeloyl-ACP methyl ester carboxylesterase
LSPQIIDVDGSKSRIRANCGCSRRMSIPRQVKKIIRFRPKAIKETGMNPEFIDVSGIRIAVRHVSGGIPGLVWLGGYRSDMLGTKAEALGEYAAQRGLMYTRHDYSGHGESSGNFADGTISRWLAESLAIFRRKTAGPQILVGSSMGAWIAIRMAQELKDAGEGKRLAGMLLLAPAPDFTIELIEPNLSSAHKLELEEKGYFEEPSEYSTDPNIYTQALLRDGRENRVMAGIIDLGCPVHIIQGKTDPDVPYTHALKLMEHLPADDTTLSLVPEGDHRLSRPQDLELILRSADELVNRARAKAGG